MSAAAPAHRPRIGVDFHTFDGIFQGSRSHLLGLYAEAIRLAPEFDFVLMLGSPERLRAEHPEFNAPNVELLAMPHGGGLARLGWQLALARRRARIDLLHVQYRLPLLPLGPCACTIHDVLFETHPQFFTPRFVQMARLTSRDAVRRSALMFAVSAFSRDEIARHYGSDAADITITYNGVNSQRFHPAADAHSDGAELVRARGFEPGQYLCTIGRIEPRKNHLNLLRGYAQLPTPRPPLLVIGQRDFSCQPVFDEVDKLGLQADVTFLESVGDRELPALLRHAMVFAYPTFAEGFGMPVAEAMASGVPVLTANVTALPEVVGDAALTADPHDPAAIAAALHSLVTQPRLRQQLAAAGVVQASRFNWRASAEALVAAYRRHFGRTPQTGCR